MTPTFSCRCGMEKEQEQKDGVIGFKTKDEVEEEMKSKVLSNINIK